MQSGRMTNDECLMMLVCWKQQRRLIHLKDDDDLNSIERSIVNIYYLTPSSHFDDYQIQYYDRIYQTFIDLCPETIQRFQELLRELLLPNALAKNEKIWRLLIVPKAIGATYDTSRDSTIIDTYRYQEQESVNTQNDDTFCSHSMTNTEDLHEAAITQIDGESQQIIKQMNTVNDDKPLNFHFEDDIADRQRRQYESEIKGRQKNSNSSSVGGVFLHASNLNGTTSYPTLQFEIPEAQLHSSWCLYLYILTDCDSNGNYYLHASKGIYDGLTMAKDKFGPIPNSNLVNPHKIELTKNDIQQGKYEIRVRVYSIPNLPIHKQKILRKFPELNRFIIYDDTNLESEFTTVDLNFRCEQYHLGCILVCNYRVQDLCVSKLATDDDKRKRK